MELRYEFAGKVALVTGGAAGIGRATVELLAVGGAQVIVADRDADQGRALAAQLDPPGSVLFVETDVSDSVSVRKMISTARNHLSRLDILVTSAGIEGQHCLLHDMPEEAFDAVIAVNLRGTYLALKHAIPWMLEGGGGSVVLVSSALAVAGAPGSCGYVASKGGVSALGRAAATEYTPLGIRINCVLPGAVDTPMTRRELAATGPVERWDNLGNRLASPSEIAEAICFLASERSSFVIGADFLVDGGKTAR